MIVSRPRFFGSFRAGSHGRPPGGRRTADCGAGHPYLLNTQGADAEVISGRPPRAAVAAPPRGRAPPTVLADEPRGAGHDLPVRHGRSATRRLSDDAARACSATDLADHLSKSKTVMISTSTTKTIVQTCQLAVGRSERRSLSVMSSLLARWSNAYPRGICCSGKFSTRRRTERSAPESMTSIT